jgi:deoxyribodipyrimidine photo-lyase
MPKRALLWLRVGDLRLVGNAALSRAVRDADVILPIFIFENVHGDRYKIGHASQWWLHHSLGRLLEEIPLQFYSGDSVTILKQLVNELQVDAVYVNERFEPHHRALDERCKSQLAEMDVAWQVEAGNLLIHPSQIKNLSNRCYTVFTHFWNACLDVLPHQCERKFMRPDLGKFIYIKTSQAVKLQELNLLPKNPNWAAGFEPIWQPGEKGALQRLEEFIQHSIAFYKNGRDFPALEMTSKLSPHLHFGEIHPQEVWSKVLDGLQYSDGQDLARESVNCFLRELGWREFSYHLLYHFPELPEENFNKMFDEFGWSENLEYFERWKRGQTGYPIVDAGMRELWHTGYMHNRIRMVVASFLTKHLLIDWRKGAEWFWDTLVDADLANNSASWQWVAGCGSDAAPFFRIFNPVLQGEKFDPNYQYIIKWVPEIRDHPSHKPWTLPPLIHNPHYPKPVVNHIEARDLALARWNSVRHRSNKVI